MNQYDDRLNFCGYFDNPQQSKPIFDPGFDVPCPACGNVIGYHSEINPLKTISLMDYHREDGKSWFFRVHKYCWNQLSDDDQIEIEMSVLQTGKNK
jgi:hypothetical protein